MDPVENDPVGSVTDDVTLVRDLIQKYGVVGFGSLVEQASSGSGPDVAPMPGPVARLAHHSTISSSARSVTSSTGTPSIPCATPSSSFYFSDPCSNGGSLGPGSPWDTSSMQWTNVLGPPTSSERSYYSDFPLAACCDTSIDCTTEPDSMPGLCDRGNGKFQCPFCFEFGIVVNTRRPQDLMKHFYNFHVHNAQWICKIGGGCGLIFDFASAYNAHTKNEHAGVKDPDAKVNLCQQVVFACGFESCREVFEAETDRDGPNRTKDYLKHVLQHLKGCNSLKWSYSRRIRNLLQQTQLRDDWNNYPNAATKHLTWQPQSSGILRKLLECRHFIDIPMLCRYAMLLGSPSRAPPVPPNCFVLPLLDTCSMPCHIPHNDRRFNKNTAIFRVAASDNRPEIFEIPRKRRAIPSHPPGSAFYSSANPSSPDSLQAADMAQSCTPTPNFDLLLHPFDDRNCQGASPHEPSLPIPAFKQTFESFSSLEFAALQPSQGQLVGSENCLPMSSAPVTERRPSKRAHLLKQGLEMFRGRRSSNPRDDTSILGNT